MGYKTVLEESTGELTEKKSRFLGQMFPVNDEQQAKDIISIIKKQHHQANHSCSAYRIRGPQLTERYSDDGEPSGTAGMPMLDVLRGAALENILVVVTRYYGGIKLGTGGLVRAYTKSCQNALESARIIEIDRFSPVSITVDYTMSGKVDYHINSEGLLLDDTEYGENVTYTIYSPEDQCETLAAILTELTNGKSTMVIGDSADGYIENGKVIIGGHQ